MRFVDRTGKKYGRLTALYRDNEKQGVHWVCKCDCGRIVSVSSSSLQSGNTKSCGCLTKPYVSALMASGTSYGVPSKVVERHRKMMNRCYDPTDKKFHLYGGKNPPVTVCKSWHDVRVYAEWLMSQPHWDEKDYTVDRVNGSGNYCPENCRVAYAKTQGRNTSRNVLVRGRCLSDWAEELGYDRHVIRNYARYHKCSLEEALDHYIAKRRGAQDTMFEGKTRGQWERRLGIHYGLLQRYEKEHDCSLSDAVKHYAELAG